MKKNTKKKAKVTKSAAKSLDKTNKRASTKRSDQVVKNVFLSSPKYALELLSLILPSSFISKMNKKSLKMESNTFVGKSGETIADMVFSFIVQKVKIKVFVLVEHKSSKDKYVHYQLLSYMAPIYKRYRSEDHVVIPVVLYHGKSRNWDIPLSFHDQLDLKGYPGWVYSFLEKHVLNFQYVLLNLHDLDVCGLVGKLTIAPLLGILKSSHRVDKVELEELFTRADKLLGLKKYKEGMELLCSASARLYDSADYDKVARLESKCVSKEKRVMIKYKSYAEELKEEGIEQGIEQNRTQVILNMLKKKMSVSDIAKLVGVSKQKVSKLKRQQHPNMQ